MSTAFKAWYFWAAAGYDERVTFAQYEYHSLLVFINKAYRTGIKSSVRSKKW